MIFVILFIILFIIGLKITGALLRAFIWLFICVPIALVLILSGMVLCCTIILIPVGRMFMGMGLRMITGGFWL